MRRRDFIASMAVGTATWPLCVWAGQPTQPPLIGVLFADKADSPFSKLFTSGFPKFLHDERGSASGGNTQIQYRFSGGDTDATRASARELIELRPNVIVAISNTAMAALHHEATSIPVVFINVSDPVGVGYVESLARPGRNVTGLTPFEPSLGGKWLSLLKQLEPSLRDAGVIFNPEPGNNSASFLRSIESAAPSLGVKTIVTPHTNSGDIERTIVALGKTPGTSGLVFLPDALTYARRNQIVDLIAQQHIPAIYPWRDFVLEGGLMSYGPHKAYADEMFHQAANYVNRILGGEKPADMPVQAPTKLILTIGMRTAKTLGLEFPASLIALAEEIIE
jgi:putative ABC transport system substrate-binding protein